MLPSTRNPLVRFLFVALALILRNVWVCCHLNWLVTRRGPGIIVCEELPRLGEMLLWLQHQPQEQFGLCVPTTSRLQSSAPLHDPDSTTRNRYLLEPLNCTPDAAHGPGPFDSPGWRTCGRD